MSCDFFIYLNFSCWRSHWIKEYGYMSAIEHYWTKCDQWPVRSVESNDDVIIKQYDFLKDIHTYEYAL
jgi:hypothetical protein